MKNLRFRDDPVVDYFREHYKTRADRAMAEAAVVDLYRRKQVSGPMGAELLGIHLTEFADLLAQHEVAYFYGPLQDVEESFARWKAERGE